MRSAQEQLSSEPKSLMTTHTLVRFPWRVVASQWEMNGPIIVSLILQMYSSITACKQSQKIGMS